MPIWQLRKNTIYRICSFLTKIVYYSVYKTLIFIEPVKLPDPDLPVELANASLHVARARACADAGRA